MLISAIIPTYKREHLLARAVKSILSQVVSRADIEVVVANDSGEPLSYADWQEDPRVTVVTTNHVERCGSRNAGFAVSRGDYVHFLDDDDMLLPGAYEALLQVALSTSAAWTCGCFELVNDDGVLLDTFCPSWCGKIFAATIGGPTLALQASMFKRDAFFSAGGFDRTFIIFEDKELAQRMTLQGDLHTSSRTVARIRVGVESSSGRWDIVDECGRLSREKAFATQSCLPEIKRSLQNIRDDSIRGKIVRYYLGSAARHAQSGSLLTAASRFGCGLQLTVPRLLSPKLWRGLICS